MYGLDLEKIENILTEAGLLSHEKLQCIERTGLTEEKELEKFLLSVEIKKYREVLELLARKMGVGYIDLENVNVNRKAIEVLDRTVARKYSVFPFDIKDNLLFLAMQNPDDIFLIDEIKVHTQMEIKSFLADFRLICKAIDCFYPVGPDEFSDVAESTMDNGYETVLNRDIQQNTAEEFAPSLEVEETIMSAVKKYLIKENVTDIRFDPLERTMTITLKARY